MWTTEPIDTVENILRIVDWYRARWTIEEYFKALKTGCAYESRQLEDYESLVNALAVFAPIACAILALRSDARRAAEAPRTVLTTTQVDVLRALGRVKLSPNPSNQETLLAVAALGGHIKYSGPPGWLTISRGYSEQHLPHPRLGGCQIAASPRSKMRRGYVSIGPQRKRSQKPGSAGGVCSKKCDKRSVLIAAQLGGVATDGNWASPFRGRAH